MSSDHTRPPQGGDKELAPSKSPEGGQGDALGARAGQALGNASDAVSTHAQHNGHEDNIAAGPTLPLGEGIQENITVTQAPERAVMWAAPGSPGSRSESPASQAGTAGGVTLDEPAQQGSDGGAAVAGPDAAELAQPAWLFVTEGNGDEAGVLHGTAGSVCGASGGAGNGADVNAAVGFGRGEGFIGTVAGVSRVYAGVVTAGFVDEETGFTAPVLSLLSERAVQESYVVVRKARAALAQNQVERDRRKDHERSAGTIKDYEADVRVLRERGKQWDGQRFPMHPICAALASYAPKKNSFNKMKSSAVWAARRQVEMVLAEQDKRQRAQPKSVSWGQSVDALNRALSELEQIQSLSVNDALQVIREVARPVESKKVVLRRANQDWRALFLAETAKSNQYRHACFLMAACGMRPAELEKGVLVQRLGNKVGVRIEGAKVTEKSGQAWRTVFIDARRFPDWFLPELSATPRKYIARSGPMRSYMHRLSPKVLTKKWKGEQLSLSPYMLRHCIATDLFQEGWSTGEIAGVLGERVEDTVRHYGLRTRGAKWREPEVMLERGVVLTAVPVRARETTFLKNKKREKKNGVKKPGM